MRDMVSCFSESSVNVSSSSYSCKSYSKNACISPALVSSVQNAVVCVYKITLSSSHRHHLVTVTWCRSHAGHGLSVDFGSDPSSSLRLSTASRLFRKKKGSKLMESDHSKVEAFWDLSAARFDSGPEPVDGFYVLIMVDSEIGLLLGDLPAARKFRPGAPVAKAHLISRREHCSGNALYSTKAQFCETGIAHELVIRCSGESEGLKHPMLSVSIDKKVVIRVKRLQWNFRGNQTIFVDGLLVDLMWDVHNWFFNPAASGSDAVFMFRTRSGMDSRLWLEEKMVHKDEEDRLDFSLLIYANRSS